MPGTSCTDNDVTLLKAGVATGPNKASATLWSAAGELASYSWSGADLAGFATADFNNANFGAQVSAVAVAGASTANVDYIQITITYTVNSVQSSCTMTGAGK